MTGARTKKKCGLELDSEKRSDDGALFSKAAKDRLY